MTALVDANVVLDVMMDREPFFAASAAVLSAVESSLCDGLLCASTVTTIHYVARRRLGTAGSLRRIASLLEIFRTAPVDESVLHAALAAGFTDFEDAVLHESAIQAAADCVVTRNAPDFHRARIPVYTPDQFLGILRTPQI